MRMLTLVLAVTLAGSMQAQVAPVSKSYKDLKYKPLKEVKLPDITTFTLSNGMKVALLENHELPVVRGTARLRTGNVLEPADKTGLSSIFGDVMRTGGTKTKTGDELNETLESIAASVEAGIGETMSTIGFNTLKENTDLVMGLFKDVLTEPEFRQDKVDLLKNQMKGVIARRNDDPHGIVAREFDALIYGGTTPWGKHAEYETIERITRQDLLDFHKRYFFPANITLSIQGDFNTAEMKTKLEKLFGGWTPKQPAVGAFPDVSFKPKPGLYIAEKTEVNQSNFMMGHLGGKLSDKDFPALEVMTDILGGSGFTSRLMKIVRSDLGLAYGVSANWNAQYDHAGTFVVSGSTKSESTAQALKVIREQIDRIRTSEVSDEELRVAKDSTLNSFVFNFDSPGKTLGRMLTYEYYGYPKDFIFQYQKAIAGVTKAEVLRVAKEYLKPEDMVLVVVGNSKDFGTPLSTLNMPENKLDITIPQPKQQAAKADAASMAKGKQLLQKLQKAVGGADKLAVKDYSHTANVTVPAMGNAKITQLTKALMPQIRFEQQFPFGKLILFWDGKGGGWMQGPQGAGALPAGAAKQAKEELFRMHPTLWMSDQNPERTVNATGANTVEISDKEGNWIELELDETTGLIKKSKYKGQDQAGPVDVESTYEDWKDVDGLKLPYKAKISQRGKVAADITIQEYKLNSGLTAEELSKKP